MNQLLYLNDFLCLTGTELENTKIKFNQYDGQDEPIEIYKREPDIVNIGWLFWRTDRRYFWVGQIAICLIQLSWDTWLLTTIKKITKDLNVKRDVNYEGDEIEKFKPFFGRVVIKYHKGHREQVKYLKQIMDKLEVLKILPSVFDGDDFPGYDKVCLSFSQLETIIHRNKRDWVAALENQKAVYLITDTKNGKQYVGSAYGENGMLLQRWTNYIKNGHGGNKELLELVHKVGFDYVKKYFQYAILENYNARVDKHIILQRETWWKETLKSRNFGYNAN